MTDLKYTAKQMEALRRYQCESGSQELNLEKAMAEHEAVRTVQKLLKPFTPDGRVKILTCVRIMMDLR